MNTKMSLITALQKRTNKINMVNKVIKKCKMHNKSVGFKNLPIKRYQ